MKTDNQKNNFPNRKSHNANVSKKNTDCHQDNVANEISANICNIHTMPTMITDEDINSLFSGILLVVKKKIELDKRAEILNINTNCNLLLKKLKEKQAECVRLKNEIIYLKSQLQATNN